MKVIGITGYEDENQQHINDAYVKAFTREGFIPVIIPTFSFGNRECNLESTKKEYENMAKGIAEKIDILVLTGGGDINPSMFEEVNYASYNTDISRDKTEMALLDEFIRLKKPIMGICRGFQLIGQKFKLNFFQQDLGNVKEEVHSGKDLDISIRNEPVHEVMLFGEFLDYYIGLHATTKTEASLVVNSWHHQGFTFKNTCKRCKDPEEISDLTEVILAESKLKVLATTAAVIEAFEHSELPIFGVQWHPEEYGNNGLTIGYFLKNYGG